MQKISATFFINTHSRQARESYGSILEAFARYGVVLQSTVELNGKNLEGELRKLAKRTNDLLIIGGGDGTVSSALNFFAGSEQHVAFIPLGTTNNYARSIGLPMDIDAAVKAIVNRTSKQVDLGVINGRYFANVAGLGLSAKIAGSVKDHLKKRFGRSAYAIEGVKQLFLYKPFMATVQDKDSELELHFETRQLIVANGKYHAGRKIATDASLSNGELLIFPLGGASVFSFIITMIDFYAGKRKLVRHGSFIIGRHVHIRTNRIVPIEFDGEVMLHTPAEAMVATSTVWLRGAK